MTTPKCLQNLVDMAKTLGPIRVAVADAAQQVVIESVHEAHELGLVEPRLVGAPKEILNICRDVGWHVSDKWLVPATTDADAAIKAARLVRDGAADAVMKGNLHTDMLMRALLDKDRGLRSAGRRVSHVFVVEVPSRDKLLGITDAAVNIAPDLNAKAQILQNAVELFRMLGVRRPKAAVLSAIETINPAVASTLDAACLTVMARRGQIVDAVVDGPLAFDNAISADAAREKGIASDVAGDADILLVPDLVSGNILAKNLGYLAGATAAGVVVGLAAPVVLTSRADPSVARFASLAIAVLMHHRLPKPSARRIPVDAYPHCAPQPEAACCPLME